MEIICLDVLVEYQERKEKQKMQLKMQQEAELFLPIKKFI